MKLHEIVISETTKHAKALADYINNLDDSDMGIAYRASVSGTRNIVNGEDTRASDRAGHFFATLYTCWTYEKSSWSC